MSESVLPDVSDKPDGEAPISVGEPACPVCGELILLADMTTDNWPASSQLGPVHQKCAAEAQATYNEWLDEQKQLDSVPLGE